MVHKDIICQKSDSFIAACTKAWVEGREGVVKVPTVPPDVMKLYVHRAYTSNIDLDIVNLPIQSDSEAPVKMDLFFSLLLSDFYIAADMFLDVALKNTTTDRLVTRSEEKCFRTKPRTLNHIWKNTSPDSGLRRLILDTVTTAWASEYLPMHGKSFSKAFLISLSAHFADQHEQRVPALAPSTSQRCLYHEHKDGDEMYASGQGGGRGKTF